MMRVQMQVRYFETMYPGNEVCFETRKQSGHLVWVDSFERDNTFMQVGGDCAWWLMHYADVEARMEHGEGLGGLA